MAYELLVGGVNRKKRKFLVSENEFVSHHTTCLNWMGLELLSPCAE